jgi:metal-responsive CopG/Arc/MetJ family transcriptional regulator
MPRTIVDIPASQLTEIDSFCRRLGISRAEAVRRALETYLERGADLHADGFGLWTDGAATVAAPAPPTPGRRRKAR